MKRCRILSIVLIATFLLAAPPISRAQDLDNAIRDLATGADFRVRVAAALVLGKSKSREAVTPLVRALSDSNLAVRTAAAAALGALGDRSAVSGLRTALHNESSEPVRKQIQTTLDRLAGGEAGAPGRKKFVVALGRLVNKSAISDPGVTSVFKSKTRAHLFAMPDAQVLEEGEDAASASKGSAVPVLMLDGTLSKLEQQVQGSEVIYSAKVEYIIRKLPEQQLKGTMAGAAEALADARSVKSRTMMARLQQDAVQAAVDSALAKARPALELALR